VHGLFQTFTPAYSGQLFRIKLYVSSPVANNAVLTIFLNSELSASLVYKTFTISSGSAGYMFLDFAPLFVLKDVMYRFTLVCTTCSSIWTSTNPYLRGYMGWPGNDTPTSPMDLEFFTYLVGLCSGLL
jgi:hypothetical protein